MGMTDPLGAQPLLPELNFRRRIALVIWVGRLRWLVLAMAAWYWFGLQSGPSTWFMRSLQLAGVLLLVGLAGTALSAWEQSLRRQFVREASLPKFLVAKIRAQHPQLSPRDAELVVRGLRQFFMGYLRSGHKFVAMPSKVVDTAWHEYILHTKGYARWCDGAFGRMLHHTPAEVLGRDARRNDGLRRSWYWACKEESIDPRQPARLPLLFALDDKFGIQGGFSYVPDCDAIGRKSDGPYCGADFGSSDAGGAGGDGEGFGGSESSGAESGGGSDGDGGCGGGCGGD